MPMLLAMIIVTMIMMIRKKKRARKAIPVYPKLIVVMQLIRMV